MSNLRWLGSASSHLGLSIDWCIVNDCLLLTVPEVSKLLHRSRARVYEMCRTGELEAIIDNCGPRGRILIPRDAVDAWITKKRRQHRR